MCGEQLCTVENVQMRVARIFLDVGKLHSLVSLQFEVDMLTLKWEAIRRVIFWVQVMRMDDDRLVKKVILEALELESKVRWVNNLHQSLERCGCRGLDVRALNGVWSDSKGSEAAIERHSVSENKNRLERGSNGGAKIRNDWEADGK